MKLLVQALAAAVAAGAIPFAFAQDTVQYVQEPVASISTDTGPDGPTAVVIARQLNADPSLKDSKITVQPVEGGITLTGTTQTYEQMRRAVKIATNEAGDRPVVNAILSPEVVMWAPPPREQSDEETLSPALPQGGGSP